MVIRLCAAEIVTEPKLHAVVETAKFALVAPAVTVTLVGTVAIAGLLLDSATAAPPAGATAVNVTVAIAVVPPLTSAGLTLTDESVIAGFTVRMVECLTPPAAAEIVAAVITPTELVDSVKFALVAPAVTVTLAGTMTVAGWLLESATTVPPVGAATVSVTVPFAVAPPLTSAGLTLSDERVVAGFTVRMVDLVTPSKAAEIVTPVTTPTELVDTVKLAFVVPAATFTAEGMAATAASLLESNTVAPPEGAAALERQTST